MGILGYVNAGTAFTVAESLCGHLVVTSQAAGWLTQDLQIGNIGGSLGADTSPRNLPFAYLEPSIYHWFDGYARAYWPTAFPCPGKETFTVAYYNDRDIADTIDPKWRCFLVWRE